MARSKAPASAPPISEAEAAALEADIAELEALDEAAEAAGFKLVEPSGGADVELAEIEASDTAEAGAEETGPATVQAEMPGFEIPQIWPPFEGHKIQRVQFAIGGSTSLYAGKTFDREIGARIKGGSRLELVIEGRIDHVGHDVIRDKKSGADIGRQGTAKLSITRIVDERELIEAAERYEERNGDAIDYVDEMQNAYLPAERGDLEAMTPAELVDSLERLSGNVADHLKRLRRILVWGLDEVRKQDEAEAERAAQAADPEALCAFCGDRRFDHDYGASCAAMRPLEMGDGETRLELCRCLSFREPASDSEAQLVIDPDTGELVAQGGESLGNQYGAGEGLSAALGIALDEASAPVCGLMHRGHISPCPYPAASCDFPAVAQPAEVTP